MAAKLGATAVGYDEWALSNALWMKCYSSHSDCKSKLKEYFHRYQLIFLMFCATNVLGIFWRHLNHPNWLLRSVYRFYLYLDEPIILHNLGISLPHENGLSKVKNSYIKSSCFSICDDYGVNAEETWMNGD